MLDMMKMMGKVKEVQEKMKIAKEELVIFLWKVIQEQAW